MALTKILSVLRFFFLCRSGLSKRSSFYKRRPFRYGRRGKCGCDPAAVGEMPGFSGGKVRALVWRSRVCLDTLGQNKTSAGVDGGDTKKDVTFHSGFVIMTLDFVESAKMVSGLQRNTGGFPAAGLPETG